MRARLGRRAVTAAAREAVAPYREGIRNGQPPPLLDEVVSAVKQRLERRRRACLQRVVNATGVVLHTNLGRAPLPRASIERIGAVASGYSTLEFDAELGERTKRGAAVEVALAELIGAEETLIVNNNAAAVLLVLSSIAAGREVLVSRGELVEIGGGFRIPEVLARSGAKLVEVGTTNRTRLDDYRNAFTERTACILRVHPSNFRIIGFTERPALADLARLARDLKVPLVKDLGGGLVLSDVEAQLGVALRGEPSAQACLQAGADVVCFSLDKLFGGPQGGVLAGSAQWIQRLRGDPFARAVRIDKLTLAALEPIVDAYATGRLDEIVVLRILRLSVAELVERLERWQRELGALGARVRVVPAQTAVGGGTLAESALESRALAIQTPDPELTARALRAHDPPVIARIENDVVLLDARTVLPDEDSIVIDAVRSALTSLPS
jgi:L-seryl-tRNA(Ser) seleniumtransferase